MMNSTIRFGVAETDEDLAQILDLQTSNLPSNLSPDEIEKEGFVTLIHDLALLKKMNTPFPHIIAKAGDQVVGYTLVMMCDMANEVPVLDHLFSHLENLTYQNVPLNDKKYFIMGQVCVHKDYRGKNVFSGLYTEMKKRMKNDFDFVITEISSKNKRSLRAHEKVGFETIKIYPSKSAEEWVVVLLDLAQPTQL